MNNINWKFIFIWGLIGMLVGWIARHIMVLLGIFFACVFAMTALWPLINDEANNSELDYIAQKRVHLFYGSQGDVTNAYVNNNSFLRLTDVSIRCGEETIKIDDIEPYSEGGADFNTVGKYCYADYDVEEGYRYRDHSTIRG